MSRVFAHDFGKRCCVLLRQEFTMLNKLSLLSFPLTLQQREEVLPTRMFRFCYDLPDDISRRFDFMDQAHGVAPTHCRNTCVPLFHSHDDLTSQLFALRHYLIIAPVPFCRKIVAQHTVSNGRREWEIESQVINFG